jgi:phosphate transport system substrate-binding protein
MKRLQRSLVVVASVFLGVTGQAETLRLCTSPAVGQALAALLPAMREAGVEARISGEASSAQAVQMIATNQADAAFTIRPMTGEDRSAAPEKPFAEVQIATQATALIVARDVWEGGVRALSKEQVRQIYEGEVTNWKQVGGADRAIKFFNHQHGQGVWEQFVQWIYGEIRRAPLGKFASVVSGEDARNAVEFNGGSMSVAPPRWADGKEVFALALQTAPGTAIEPTPARLLDRTYPLARPVLVVFADKPTGMRQRLVDFLLGQKCKELLVKNGLIPVP